MLFLLVPSISFAQEFTSIKGNVILRGNISDVTAQGNFQDNLNFVDMKPKMAYSFSLGYTLNDFAEFGLEHSFFGKYALGTYMYTPYGYKYVEASVKLNTTSLYFRFNSPALPIDNYVSMLVFFKTGLGEEREKWSETYYNTQTTQKEDYEYLSLGLELITEGALIGIEIRKDYIDWNHFALRTGINIGFLFGGSNKKESIKEYKNGHKQEPHFTNIVDNNLHKPLSVGDYLKQQAANNQNTQANKIEKIEEKPENNSGYIEQNSNKFPCGEHYQQEYDKYSARVESLTKGNEEQESISAADDEIISFIQDKMHKISSCTFKNRLPLIPSQYEYYNSRN